MHLLDPFLFDFFRLEELIIDVEQVELVLLLGLLDLDAQLDGEELCSLFIGLFTFKTA